MSLGPDAGMHDSGLARVQGAPVDSGRCIADALCGHDREQARSYKKTDACNTGTPIVGAFSPKANAHGLRLTEGGEQGEVDGEFGDLVGGAEGVAGDAVEPGAAPHDDEPGTDGAGDPGDDRGVTEQYDG